MNIKIGQIWEMNNGRCVVINDYQVDNPYPWFGHEGTTEGHSWTDSGKYDLQCYPHSMDLAKLVKDVPAQEEVRNTIGKRLITLSEGASSSREAALMDCLNSRLPEFEKIAKTGDTIAMWDDLNKAERAFVEVFGDWEGTVDDVNIEITEDDVRYEWE